MGPSKRDRKMALEACRNFARDGAFIWPEVAKQIAAAREQGRREPRPITDALATLEASVWQPIETAPKDGTKILLFVDNEIKIAHWEPSSKPEQPWLGCQGNPSDDWFDERWEVEEPTHWRPLPEPPR